MPTERTKLSEREELKYQRWRSTIPKNLQYEGDYDLRGFWKENPTWKADDPKVHMGDKYKMSTHPTFSNESKYAVGENKDKAGSWSYEKGKDVFTASNNNLQNKEFFNYLEGENVEVRTKLPVVSNVNRLGTIKRVDPSKDNLPSINYDKVTRDAKAPVYSAEGLPTQKEAIANYIKSNPTEFPKYFKALPETKQKEAFNEVVRERPNHPMIKALMYEAAFGGMAPVAGLEYVSKIPGVKKTLNYIGNKIKPEAVERLLTNEELLLKRAELAENGILREQKTLDMPYKDIIHKGVDPFGYDVKEKIGSLKSLIKDSKNPMYIPEDKITDAYKTYLRLEKADNPLSLEDFASKFNPDQLEPSLKNVTLNRFGRRFAKESPTGTNSLTNKNRYATWNMYLGKSQAEHPIYDVSKLSTNKNTVYTIKKPYMDQKEIESTLQSKISVIEDFNNNPIDDYNKANFKDFKISKNSDMSYNVPDRDHSYFGTMGGFNWKIKPLENGNYEAIADDVWDLQPFKNQIIGDSDKLSGRLLNAAIKPFKKTEVGKALGIGKPIDVKVGFELDGKTKKIINTFGLTGVGYGLNKMKNGKSE